MIANKIRELRKKKRQIRLRAKQKKRLPLEKSAQGFLSLHKSCTKSTVLIPSLTLRAVICSHTTAMTEKVLVCSHMPMSFPLQTIGH